MATVRDIAARVGVSVSTVSRALTMPHMVNAATRARVLAAAEELGYQPNTAARGLRSGVTNNIGLVVPDIANPYFAAVTKGVQDRARQAGFAVFVADSDEDPQLEEQVVSSIAKQVDGLILSSPRADEERIVAASGGKPIVVLNRRFEGAPSLLIDNASGIDQALDHLRALGHRRVAYAAGPAASWSGSERIREVRRYAEAHDDIEIVELGNFRPYVTGGHQVADLAVAAGATALFAYNDLVAIGALERLRARGIAVPADMSVIGFDNVGFAELTFPTLTTVAIPLLALGKRGVDALTRHISGRTAERGDLLSSVELRIRQSTAPPPTHD